MNSYLSKGRYFAPVARFVSENYFHTLLILFVAIVTVFFSNKVYVPGVFKLLAPWALFFLAFATEARQRVWLLFLINIMLVAVVAINFYSIANHGFMIAYIGLALMFAIAANEDGPKLMQRSALYLLAALMGLALIQKVTAGYYMQGNLLGELLIKGEIYRFAGSLLFDNWTDLTTAAQDAKLELNNTSPVDGNVVTFVMPAGAILLAMLLTAASLVSQAGLEVALLLRRRIGIWVHFAVLAFVLIIYSSRNENTFLSMNCLLGYALTDEDSKQVRILYVIWVFFLLSMNVMGVRPGFFG